MASTAVAEMTREEMYKTITAALPFELGDSKACFIFTWLFKYLINIQKARKICLPSYPPLVSTTEITSNVLLEYIYVFAVT